MDQKFSAIILAAGQGTRMKSTLPKVLHKVLGVTMIDSVVSRAEQAGADDVIVVIGHGADLLRQHFSDSDLRLAQQQHQLGTAHALLAALQQTPPRHRDLLVSNGDLPDLDPTHLHSIINAHRSNQAAFTIGTSSVKNPYGMGRH